MGVLDNGAMNPLGFRLYGHGVFFEFSFHIVPRRIHSILEGML